MNHNELGIWGEKFAADYLLRKGYEILERNWFFDKAEIDIIARQGEQLELKQRGQRSEVRGQRLEENKSPAPLSRSTLCEEQFQWSAVTYNQCTS